MADWTPAQIEAAADAIALHDGEPYPVAARAALTAAAQVQPEPKRMHTNTAGLHATDRATNAHGPQPAPEADEREALILTVAHAMESLRPTLTWRRQCEIVADAILARRSQPAPRTVSAAEVHAAWHVVYPRQDGPPPGYVWPFLAALDITVEAPRD